MKSFGLLVARHAVDLVEPRLRRLRCPEAVVRYARYAHGQARATAAEASDAPTEPWADHRQVLKRGVLKLRAQLRVALVTVPDRDLSRRVLLTYAELPARYRHMGSADAQMGRRLLGLVRRSPLHLQTVQAYTTVLASLREAWEARLAEVAFSVRRSAGRGLGHVSDAELGT